MSDQNTGQPPTDPTSTPGQNGPMSEGASPQQGYPPPPPAAPTPPGQQQEAGPAHPGQEYPRPPYPGQEEAGQPPAAEGYAQQGYPQQDAGYPGPPPAYGQVQPYAYGPGQLGPVGKIRSTGVAILLMIVTLGIYSWYWYFKTHEEMKRHTGQGIGGGIALILAIFVSIVMPYLNSSEVGQLYERAGREKPVSGATGLWYFPGMLIIVGPIIWFVKTNGALNRYWESMGATKD